MLLLLGISVNIICGLVLVFLYYKNKNKETPPFVGISTFKRMTLPLKRLKIYRSIADLLMENPSYPSKPHHTICLKEAYFIDLPPDGLKPLENPHILKVLAKEASKDIKFARMLYAYGIKHELIQSSVENHCHSNKNILANYKVSLHMNDGATWKCRVKATNLSMVLHKVLTGEINRLNSTDPVIAYHYSHIKFIEFRSDGSTVSLAWKRNINANGNNFATWSLHGYDPSKGCPSHHVRSNMFVGSTDQEIRNFKFNFDTSWQDVKVDAINYLKKALQKNSKKCCHLSSDPKKPFGWVHTGFGTWAAYFNGSYIKTFAKNSVELKPTGSNYRIAYCHFSNGDMYSRTFKSTISCEDLLIEILTMHYNGIKNKHLTIDKVEVSDTEMGKPSSEDKLCFTWIRHDLSLDGLIDIRNDNWVLQGKHNNIRTRLNAKSTNHIVTNAQSLRMDAKPDDPPVYPSKCNYQVGDLIKSTTNNQIIEIASIDDALSTVDLISLTTGIRATKTMSYVNSSGYTTLMPTHDKNELFYGWEREQFEGVENIWADFAGSSTRQTNWVLKETGLKRLKSVIEKHYPKSAIRKT